MASEVASVLPATCPLRVLIPAPVLEAGGLRSLPQAGRSSPERAVRPGPAAQQRPVFQALGSITAVPAPGPQVSSLQRLAGQGVAVLPQVRPKTLIPDSLPVTPGRDRPPKQPPTFQKAAVVSIKNPSPALPTANNTVSHAPAPGSQPQALAEPAAITSPLSSAGVAYAIISTAPSNAAAIAPSNAAVSVVSDSIKVQPLLISTDNKVRLCPRQAQASRTQEAPAPEAPSERGRAEGKTRAEWPSGRRDKWGHHHSASVQTQPESKAESRPPTEEPSQGAQATNRKEDRPPSQENPEKIAFMVALGLVTTEHLEEAVTGGDVMDGAFEEAAGFLAGGMGNRGVRVAEIQSKRQERKRRSTANPAYSGLLETGAQRPPGSPGTETVSLSAVAVEEAAGVQLPEQPPVPHGTRCPLTCSPPFLPVLANEDPCWKSEIARDEHCAACKRGANLQPCGSCPAAYHLGCLDPPLKTAPKGVWVCPKCQQKVPSALQALKKDESVPWTGMLAIVRSYVTHKTGGTRAAHLLPLSPSSRPIGGCSGRKSGKRALGWAWVQGSNCGGMAFPSPRVQPGPRLLREGVACRRRPRLPTADLPPGRGPALSPVKEEEKQKLLQRGSELQSGRQQLEERDRRLASAVKGGDRTMVIDVTVMVMVVMMMEVVMVMVVIEDDGDDGVGDDGNNGDGDDDGEWR
ncbi:hypothetical protein QTO34_012898 [Cnephaeus nilssonii]|uniref:PHD-type domain-containing protein n=1 Tax=Cnephaeus nilssonii TaxID=3371016 RepID=A0AA40HAF5_CNENI|nr:hypothetical protein QTO34_012898 [Eptesicus nilssonii]